MVCGSFWGDENVLKLIVHILKSITLYTLNWWNIGHMNSVSIKTRYKPEKCMHAHTPRRQLLQALNRRGFTLSLGEARCTEKS